MSDLNELKQLHYDGYSLSTLNVSKLFDRIEELEGLLNDMTQLCRDRGQKLSEHWKLIEELEQEAQDGFDQLAVSERKYEALVNGLQKIPPALVETKLDHEYNKYDREGLLAVIATHKAHLRQLRALLEKE